MLCPTLVGIDQRDVLHHHLLVAQPPHALEAGRRRQPDALGERQIGDLVVLLQDGEDAPVDGIERDRAARGAVVSRLDFSQISSEAAIGHSRPAITETQIGNFFHKDFALADGGVHDPVAQARSP